MIFKGRTVIFKGRSMIFHSRIIDKINKSQNKTTRTRFGRGWQPSAKFIIFDAKFIVLKNAKFINFKNAKFINFTHRSTRGGVNVFPPSVLVANASWPPAPPMTITTGKLSLSQETYSKWFDGWPQANSRSLRKHPLIIRCGGGLLVIAPNKVPFVSWPTCTKSSC